MKAVLPFYVFKCSNVFCHSFFIVYVVIGHQSNVNYVVVFVEYKKYFVFDSWVVYFSTLPHFLEWNNYVLNCHEEILSPSKVHFVFDESNRCHVLNWVTTQTCWSVYFIMTSSFGFQNFFLLSYTDTNVIYCLHYVFE